MKKIIITLKRLWFIARKTRVAVLISTLKSEL